MAENFKFDLIEDALEDLKNGKIIMVVDDEDRENEGDFIKWKRDRGKGRAWQKYNVSGCSA